MGDENYASGGFMCMTDGSGEWKNIGYVCEDGISLTTDDDDLDVWQGKPFDMDESVTIALKPTWWSLNSLYKLVTGRCMYTVPMLRKAGKGHKGKGRRHGA